MILEKLLFATFLIRFLVCIKSAFVEVIIHIFFPGKSCTADAINSDLPYDVGAIIDTVFFTFDSVLYSALGSVRKETQLLLHFFPQGRRHFKAHSTPKLK